ncbi:MAG: hypothetical protein K0S07_1277 [Chlamydiales bacterium]|jgi:hypothetical protein|nr:hypothetical protein [Chlamydiales bacterium]
MPSFPQIAIAALLTISPLLKAEEISVPGGFYYELVTTQPWVYRPVALGPEVTIHMPTASSEFHFDITEPLQEYKKEETGLVTYSALIAEKGKLNPPQAVLCSYYRSSPPPVSLEDYVNFLLGDPAKEKMRKSTATFGEYPGLFYQQANPTAGNTHCGFCFCHQNKIIAFDFAVEIDAKAEAPDLTPFVKAFMEQVTINETRSSN